MSAASDKHKHDFIFIKSDYKIFKIKFEDILFCKGMKDYIQVYVKGKSQPLVTLKSLNSFETRLPSKFFIRVHRSYIVSLHHIDTIARNEIFVAKHIIPIGNIYKANFFSLVDAHS